MSVFPCECLNHLIPKLSNGDPLRQHPLNEEAPRLEIELKTALVSHLAQSIPNDLDPTVFIPPEILAHVFNFYLSSCMPAIGPGLKMTYHKISDLYCWLSIPEVCRRWYVVAVHTPELWATIHLPLKPAFVDICFAALPECTVDGLLP